MEVNALLTEGLGFVDGAVSWEECGPGEQVPQRPQPSLPASCFSSLSLFYHLLRCN